MLNHGRWETRARKGSAASSNQAMASRNDVVVARRSVNSRSVSATAHDSTYSSSYNASSSPRATISSSSLICSSRAR